MMIWMRGRPRGQIVAVLRVTIYHYRIIAALLLTISWIIIDIISLFLFVIYPCLR